MVQGEQLLPKIAEIGGRTETKSNADGETVENGNGSVFFASS
jgi:hypothetical protein